MEFFATLRIKGSDETLDVYRHYNHTTLKSLEGRRRSNFKASYILKTIDGREVEEVGKNTYKIIVWDSHDDIELEAL